MRFETDSTNVRDAPAPTQKACHISERLKMKKKKSPSHPHVHMVENSQSEQFLIFFKKSMRVCFFFKFWLLGAIL